MVNNGLKVLDVFALKDNSILELLVHLYHKLNVQQLLILFHLPKLVNVSVAQVSQKLAYNVYAMVLRQVLFVTDALKNQTQDG